MHYVGISTYQPIPYNASATHKHTHTHASSNHLRTANDGAQSGYCRRTEDGRADGGGGDELSNEQLEDGEGEQHGDAQ